MLAKLTHRLRLAECEACEGSVSALQVTGGKTPSSDGFPMEFYLTFWQSLSADLVQILNFAFESGQLFTSQHRGLITVMQKE